MLEEAAPYTYVYGGDPPFGFGIYISQEECFKDQVRKRPSTYNFWYMNDHLPRQARDKHGESKTQKKIFVLSQVDRCNMAVR